MPRKKGDRNITRSNNGYLFAAVPKEMAQAIRNYAETKGVTIAGLLGPVVVLWWQQTAEFRADAGKEGEG